MAKHKILIVSTLTTVVLFLFITIIATTLLTNIFDNSATSTPVTEGTILASPLPATFIPPALDTPVPRPTTRTFVGEPIPDIVIQTLNGEQTSLANYQDKIIVLNFWATWCPPCVREMPALIEFQQNAPDDVMVIALTAPNNDQTMSEVLQFLDDYDLDALNVLLDPHLSLHNALAVLVMPTTLFINADGIIVKRISGELDLTQLDNFVQEARNS